MRGRAGRRGLWIVAGIAAAGAALAVVAVWHLPAWMYPAVEQSEARAALQGGLLTAAAALLAVAGGLIALDETRQANANTHVRELYTAAIGMLGADTIDVRLGGIYALERVARDSAADQRTVVEVLAAFVREHTRTRLPTPMARRPAPWRRGRTPFRNPPPGDDWPPEGPPTDIQAALTALGRLPARKGLPRVDLSGSELVGANLIDANLAGARLGNANLTDAQLRTNLTGAWMSGTNLTRAALATANLTRAELYGAILTAAWISEANLHGAGLGGADLTRALLIKADLSDASLHGARLTRASLTEADLTGANLERADLTGAKLHGANLSGTRGLTAEQLSAALGNARTRLPEGVARPISWPPYDPSVAPDEEALREIWRPFDSA